MPYQQKSSPGPYFEDFELGAVISHAAPWTISDGDVSLYHALTGNRFAIQISTLFAQSLGYPSAPVDDILLFNGVFGLSVADISQNATANLGYADCVFVTPVFVGYTIQARSTIIGMRETSDGKSGIVYVRTEGLDHKGAIVLYYTRWVMIPKRDASVVHCPEPHIPDLPDQVTDIALVADWPILPWDFGQSGATQLWDDYQVGEKIDHINGVTVDATEHTMATRLYRNSARVHFDDQMMQKTPFGQRLVYGGHVISLVRALSHNGLANACLITAIHGGQHSAPVFAGETLYAWTEVTAKLDLNGRPDLGLLRLQTRAVKNRACADFPETGDDVVLTLDYTILIPKS